MRSTAASEPFEEAASNVGILHMLGQTPCPPCATQRRRCDRRPDIMAGKKDGVTVLLKKRRK